MVGTGPEFVRFLETLRKGGAPLLKPATFAEATRNQVGTLPREAKDEGWRFGYFSAVLADPAVARTPQSVGTLRWGGVFGHDWFVDRAAGLTVLSLTNTAVEPCLGSYPKELRNAVYGVSPR
jgi:CubicO group peptidase (beta-lactamase class C family)